MVPRRLENHQCDMEMAGALLCRAYTVGHSHPHMRNSHRTSLKCCLDMYSPIYEQLTVLHEDRNDHTSLRLEWVHALVLVFTRLHECDPFA